MLICLTDDEKKENTSEGTPTPEAPTLAPDTQLMTPLSGTSPLHCLPILPNIHCPSLKPMASLTLHLRNQIRSRPSSPRRPTGHDAHRPGPSHRSRAPRDPRQNARHRRLRHETARLLPHRHPRRPYNGEIGRQ